MNSLIHPFKNVWKHVKAAKISNFHTLTTKIWNFPFWNDKAMNYHDNLKFFRGNWPPAHTTTSILFTQIRQNSNQHHVFENTFNNIRHFMIHMFWVQNCTKKTNFVHAKQQQNFLQKKIFFLMICLYQGQHLEWHINSNCSINFSIYTKVLPQNSHFTGKEKSTLNKI